MLTDFINMFQYDFIVRAFIAGILISICAALLGTNLILRRQSMIGDGLSHVAFGATVIALSLGFTPLYFAIPTVLIASFLILRISNNKHINGDAAIAILSTSALAIGAVVNALSPGSNIDINSYLFGSILAINQTDIIIIAIVAIASILLYFTFYRQIFAITIDERFAKSVGIKTDLYNAILAAICFIHDKEVVSSSTALKPVLHISGSTYKSDKGAARIAASLRLWFSAGSAQAISCCNRVIFIFPIFRVKSEE